MLHHLQTFSDDSHRILFQNLHNSIIQNFEGFQAYFQPIYDVRKKRITAAETLMRFHSPKNELVPPSVFIPILEKTGLIIPAGQWILHKALSFCKDVQTYIPDFRVSINLSSIQFSQGNICTEILSALKRYNITTTSLISELTESYSLDTSKPAFRSWTSLQNAGISLALDDFGTGYSNFRYISDLSPNIIKIDRSFITSALKHQQEPNLLSLFCDMIHKLNLEICLEGIESLEEMTLIQKWNPDYIQGFYFGRPCSCQRFLEKYVLIK